MQTDERTNERERTVAVWLIADYRAGRNIVTASSKEEIYLPACAVMLPTFR